jgi:rod shape-determining protein MreC
MIVFRNNSYQQSSYINSSSRIAGKFYQQKEKMIAFMNLTEMNDSLLKENAILRNKLGINRPANPLSDTSFTKIIKLDSMVESKHYTYIPARVLNNSIDQKINYITLDVGSKQGIRKNFAVISQNGIVGKISHVSENYSLAVSFLSEKFKVGCRLADSTVGFLVWDGKDPEFGTLTGIPQSVKMKPLDSVFTNGFSMFPENILVGRAVKLMNGGNYKIYLSTKFRKLHFVYVIAEESNIERIHLEEDSTKVTQ